MDTLNEQRRRGDRRPTVRRSEGRTIDAPMAPLSDLILAAQDNLLGIKCRWYVLERAEAELAACTRGKQYRIDTDVVLNTLIDTHDMLGIDLASFATDMLEQGGLLGDPGGLKLIQAAA